MIISHRHKFIFIKTRKTAGTSIEIALSEFCGEDDIITPIMEKDEAYRREIGFRGSQNYFDSFRNYRIKDWERLILRRKKKRRFHDHISAKKIKRKVEPEIWNTYFKFCFERNPWDKVISFYYFHYKTEPRPPFSEFVDSRIWEDISDFSRYTIDGEVAVDFIGRYERLEEDLRHICERLELPPLKLPLAKASFRKDKRPYQEIFKQEQREVIEKVFSNELQLMGYQFE